VADTFLAKRSSPAQPSGHAAPAMSALALSALALVRAYQVGVAPLTGGACRFTPSCSAYAIEAIEIHGAARGLWLALRRVARCHPWGGFGHDPVPHAHGPACAGGSSRTLES
jgi:putative membrane protein insertion efficiency factor